MAMSAVGVVALAYTLIRLGYVMCVIGWLLLAITTRRKIVGVLGLLGLATVLASSPLWLPERVTAYLQRSTIGILESSTAQRPLDQLLSGRLTIWTAAIEYLGRDPKRYIWGGGRLDFQVKGPEFGLPFGYMVHQSILQTMVGEGLIGVVAILGVFARIVPMLWRDWRSHPSEEVRHLSRLMLIVTVLLFVSSSPWESRPVSWYWFLVGMFVAAREDWTREQSSAAVVRASVPQPRFVGAGAMPIRPASASPAQ
jgi:O-antigen ligase